MEKGAGLNQRYEPRPLSGSMPSS